MPGQWTAAGLRCRFSGQSPEHRGGRLTAAPRAGGVITALGKWRGSGYVVGSEDDQSAAWPPLGRLHSLPQLCGPSLGATDQDTGEVWRGRGNTRGHIHTRLV